MPGDLSDGREPQAGRQEEGGEAAGVTVTTSGSWISVQLRPGRHVDFREMGSQWEILDGNYLIHGLQTRLEQMWSLGRNFL